MISNDFNISRFTLVEARQWHAGEPNWDCWVNRQRSSLLNRTHLAFVKGATGEIFFYEIKTMSKLLSEKGARLLCTRITQLIGALW